LTETVTSSGEWAKQKKHFLASTDPKGVTSDSVPLACQTMEQTPTSCQDVDIPPIKMATAKKREMACLGTQQRQGTAFAR
jgi:hypothetical protein